MPLHETESIVLKSYNLAEADRIVVFFTRSFGVIRGVAKGARRTRSKFGSSLEPFSEISLEYFQKDDRELVSVQRADLVRSAFFSAARPELRVDQDGHVRAPEPPRGQIVGAWWSRG